MTKGECLKLAKILARKNSPFLGEREAAERLANAFLAKHSRVAQAAAPAARDIATAASPAMLVKSRTERRRQGSGAWRGYCRRRQATAGAALNIAV